MGKKARLATIFDLTENEILKKEKKLADKKLQQVEKMAIAKERALLGEELHDNINQILASTKLYLEIALTNEPSRVDLIQRCKHNITKVMEEIRQLSKTLVGSLPNDFDLLFSLEELIESYAITNAFIIHFTPDEDLQKLPHDLQLTVFRIIQEQLTNILKHAQARDVWITLEVRQSLILHIKDNGKGFILSKRKNGIGLENIRKRTTFYNGHFNIFSNPGNGTTLRITIPIVYFITS